MTNRTPFGKRFLPAIGTTVLAATLVAGSVSSAQAAAPWVTLPGTSSTNQVAVDSPLHRVFVLADSATHPTTRVLSIIDSTTDTVIGTPIPLLGGDFIADDYQTHKVFITDSKAGKVTIVDGRSGAITGTSAKLSDDLANLVVDPFNQRVFIMDAHHDLFTLDESGAPVRKMLTIPGTGTNLALDFWLDKLYVPNDLYGTGIAVIDSENSTFVTTLPVSALTGDIVADPFNHTIAVGTQTSLTTIDTRTDSVALTLPLPSAASRATSVGFISHTFFVTVGDQLWTLHGTTMNRLAADNIGQMAVDYLSHKVYAAYFNRPWVSVIWE